MESLEAHLRSLLSRVARTSAWRSLEPAPLCRELERRIEAANPDDSEERISSMCHKRLRKLGNALRCGWELELLGLAGAQQAARGSAAAGEAVDFAAVLDRLETLGAAKQSNYRHIKAGDRQGAASLMLEGTEAAGPPDEQREGEPEELQTTPGSYGSAVEAQRGAMWHRQALAAVVEVMQGLGAQRVIDVGSSFNPLEGLFPHVTALDPVPQAASVLQADFFNVDVVDGLSEVRTDPARPGRCLAVPGAGYDAALLSLVLRSLRRVEDRRLMIRRVARTLRPGGLLVVVEKNALASLLKYRGPRDTPWRDAGMERRRTIGVSRGVLVNVFERAGEAAA